MRKISFKSECEEITKKKKISIKESRTKSTILFNNPREFEVKKIQVDGCQITDNRLKKCDYMLIITNTEVEYFIELKGQNLNRAIEQIESTINQLSQNPKSHLKKCFIITTKRPATAPKIQRLKDKFRANFNSELIVKNAPYKYPIS